MPEFEEMQLPEETVELEPVVTAIDYSPQLDLIYGDVSSMKHILEEQQKIVPFDYTENFATFEQLLVEIRDEVKPSESSAVVPEYDLLLEQLDAFNLHLSNIESVVISILVGVGLIAGILCSLVFSSVFKH